VSTANTEQAASYDIIVDGVDLAPEEKNRIREIVVIDYLRLPDVCTVEVTYPRADGIDSLPFEIGKEIEIRLGAAAERVAHTLFKGSITTVEPDFGSHGCSVLVRAYDRSHVLHRSRRARTFQNQTSSDIVEKIVSEAGLTPKCDPSGEPHDFIQQDNETNWDHILSHADRIGFEFVVDDTTAYFRKPKADSAVELVWPETLYSFSPRVTAVQQVKEVTLLAHDPKTKSAIESSAKSPEQIAQIGVDRQRVADAFDAAPLHIATEPVKSKAEGDALTQALLDKLANGYVAAHGHAKGNPKIKAGAKVKVSGVGSKFSGTYRVAMSKHVLRGTYDTYFANSPSHTILGAVGTDGQASPRFGSQLVLGVVTNNHDPDSMGRVRVKFPALGGDVESAWARIATTSAGKERGLLMLPVVGEEVLIGFEHGDTTRPYVLGSLFNGKDAPGDDLLQDASGSFALKSDAKIYTESKQDYTLKTDGKLTVEVGNSVDEQFKADWTNKTGGKASVKATRDLELEGQNVTIKGAMQISIEANSTLELKCGPASIQLGPSGVTISGPVINLG